MNLPDIYEPGVRPSAARHAVRGVDYHVSEWGRREAPLLVLLHGWGDTGSCFQFLVDELTAEYFVVAPDWRGFGDTRHVAESYWFPDYLADLQQLLEIYSPQEPARLVGHSMGGNVAGMFAGVMPERVAAFVNIEGFGLQENEPGNAPANYRRWIERSLQGPQFSTYASFDALQARIRKNSPRLSQRRAAFIARQWASESDDSRIHLKADPAHKLPNAIQYRRAEAVACWERVTAPVLLVTGADSDVFAGGGFTADVDPPALPFSAASHVVVPDAGHMVHFEQPAALAVAIETFLKDL